MPVFTFTSPDGKTYDVTAPEGATQEQAFSMLQTQLGTAHVVSQEQAAPTAPTTQEDLARQLGLTARAAGEGIAGTVGIVTDPISAMINQALPESQQILPFRQAVSEVLTRVGVPNPQTDTERLVQAAAQSLTGAGATIGAARGAATLAQRPELASALQSLAAQPAQQAAGAVGAGASAEEARQAGMGQAAQLAAGLAGGVAGAGLAGITSAAPQAIPKAVSEAERIGIKVPTSDIAPPRTFVGRQAQIAGERIPFAGTGAMRQEQQVQRIQAVKDVLRDYGVTGSPNVSDDVMRDLASQRGKDLQKYTSLKRDVINRLDDAGSVPVPNTVAKIDEQINMLSSISAEANAPVIARLQQFKNDIQGKTMTNIEENRKILGEAFSDPNLSAIRSTGEKAVNQVYGSLRQDMADFIRQYGEKNDLTKWKVANQRLAAMSGELENSTLKNVLKRGDATPEVIQNMLFSKKPSDIRTLYRGLSPQGRASARMAILDKAAQNAGGLENISPDRFKNELNKLGSPIGVFFSGDDLQRIEGLKRALELTKRAGEFAASPPTGVQIYTPVMAAALTDLFGGMGAGIASAVTIGGMTRAYESKPVRDILMKLPRVSKGSAEEAALFKRLAATIQATKE